ncbi:MAG: hypothetical protein CME28_07135 [Gemmatimonadetes bacterium]|nr:hypothetical protein [Gemmatimonadota bacterium]
MPPSSRIGLFISFLLVLVFSILMTFTSVRTYVLYGSYTGLTDHFNTIGVVFLIFWMTLCTLFLRIVHATLALSATNFALIYAGLMVATVLPSMGFGGYFIPLIAGVFYYATPENNWSDILWPHIPSWAAPRDIEAIRQLFEGTSEGAAIPWDLWWEPMLWWGLFMLAFFLVSFALIALVHNQWSQRERLAYPLAAVPNMLLDSIEKPRTSILRSKLLWLGFFFAWHFPTINALDQLFDFELIGHMGIPSGEISIRQFGLSYQLNTDLLVVGLSYLVNLNVLASVWVFHLLVGAEASLLNYLGINAPLPAQPHAPANVLLAHQQIGSLLCLVAVSLWLGRDFLREQWHIIIGKQSDSENLVSPRIAALLGLIGLVYMAGFLHASGLALGWSLVFLGVSLLVFFGITRLLAQTGIGRLRAPTSTPPIITNIAGSEAIGAQGISALGLSMVWTADLQLFLMGTLAHAFRVCEPARLRISGRKLLVFLSGAMIVGLVTTILSYIYLGYRHGLVHGYVWYFVMSPQYHWSWVANTINNPNPSEPLAILFMGIGAAWAALLSLASYRWVSWPFHPVGLAVALTNTVSIDWFGMFLAWLIKLLILRYGGIVLYRRMLPLFIGLILGTSVGIGGASLLYAFYYY